MFLDIPSEHHSHPQSARSFWPVAGIGALVWCNTRSPIHGLAVQSSKSDWLRMQNEYSAHAQKIGFGQSPRSLQQARRIVRSGDENVREQLFQACGMRHRCRLHETLRETQSRSLSFRYPCPAEQENRVTEALGTRLRETGWAEFGYSGTSI